MESNESEIKKDRTNRNITLSKIPIEESYVSAQYDGSAVAIHDDQFKDDAFREASRLENLLAEDRKYLRYNLGLLQSLLMVLTQNAKGSLLLAITTNAILNMSDTASDIGMANWLLIRDLQCMAYILISIDFFPALLVTLHHTTSKTWSKISRRQQIGTALLLLVQPFSVIATAVAWMLKIESEHRHYLSRLSTIIHGHLESPLQLALFIYLWSKGYIRTPWEETSQFTDQNGNTWSMGNVLGTLSLTMTICGMCKGCMDSFESTDMKFKFFTFSSLNMVYRIGSVAFYSQYFNDPLYISIFLILLIAITLVLFLRRGKLHGKRISVISSVICSIVVPVTTTERPHHYQINLQHLNEEERRKEAEERKKCSDEMRRNSGLLSLVTSPLFLFADLCVVIAVKDGEFRNTSIWTNDQLIAWACQFFIPLCIASMLSAWSIYQSEAKEVENDDSGKGFIKLNYLSIISVLVTILTVALHATHLSTTNSYLFAFVANNHELKMFEGRTSFDIASFCQEGKCDFSHANIINQDYRKLQPLEHNTIYVDEKINITDLPKKFRLIMDGLDWDRIINENTDHKLCKRCLAAGKPQYNRCKTLSYEGYNIEDCKKTCSLPDIQNGAWESRIESTPNTRIHVAKYYCDKGYFEADSEERRCSSLETLNLNSQYVSPNKWSGKKPLCIKIADEIVITTGYDESYLNDTELIMIGKDGNLKTTLTTCKLPDYPMTLNSAKGTFLSESNATMICGGGKYQKKTATNKCYRFTTDSTSWNEVSSLRIARYYHAIASVGTKIVTCGGWTAFYEVLSSCEMLASVNGQWKKVKSLPVELAGHCMVTMDASTIVVIGGRDRSGSTNKMYRYDLSSNQWTETYTPMTQKRQGHECIKIDDDRIMVIGGRDENYDYLKSTEIVSLGRGTWDYGPSFPTAIANGQFVKATTGTKFLGYYLGGSVDRKPSSAIYALYKDLNSFQLLGHLERPRESHVGFQLPESISNKCVKSNNVI